MLQRSILLSLLLLLVNISFSFAQSTAVDAHGQLAVSGTRIVDQNADTVQFQGMSLYWSNLWGSTDYYTAGAVSEIQNNWCANIIRAAMGTSDDEAGSPVNGGYLDDSAGTMDQITNVVEAAIDTGMYVIIDWHGHGAHNNEQEALEFFSYMAQQYGDQPNVIYEIYNEPLDVSWSNTIKPYCENVIDTIRHYDPDNIIVCGTPNWCQDVGAAADDPIADTNIMYTLHYYAGTHDQWLRDNAQNALNQGLPLFVTEYGNVNADGDGDVAETEANNWYNFLRQNDIGYLNWSLTDQNEGSAALQDGASADGGWTAHDITSSGTFVRNHLTSNCPPYSSVDVDVSLTSPSSDTTVSDCNVSVTLKASASAASGSIDSVEFFANGESLGADSSEPYSITWNDVPKGENSVRAIATNSNGEYASTLFRSITREKRIYTVSSSPVVDGAQESVWLNHPSDSLSKVSAGSVGSADDLSVTYKTAYDSDSLYFLVDVTDDSKINDSDADWQDDAVEIFLDIGNNKNSDYGNSEYQFIYAWGSGGGSLSLNSNNISDLSVINFAKTDQSDGYTVEFAFGWSDLGLSNPSSGTKLGMDVQVNDDDYPGGDRDAKVAWSDGDDVAWNNPSAFGTGVLKGSDHCHSSNSMDVSLTSPSSDTTVSGCGLSVTLEASASTDYGSISNVEFFANGESLGTDSDEPYSITWDDIPTEENSVRAVATNSNGQGISTSYRSITREKWVANTSSSPIIDGSEESLWLDYSSDSLFKESIGDINSPNDLSVTYKMTYDSDSLYYIVNVTDDNKTNDSNEDIQDDAIEIFLDIGNDKDTTYGDDDYQFVYAWESSGNGTLSESHGGISDVSVVNYAKTDEPGGYTVEFAFGWSDLGLNDPYSGLDIGMDVQVTDDDDGNGRDAKIAWSDEHDIARNNTSAFGTVTLAGSDNCSINAVYGSASKPAIDIYPNPFTNYLNVQLEDNNQGEVVLLDLKGREMLTEEVVGEARLSLNHLQTGMYLLRIETGGNIYHYKVNKR